MQSRSGCSAVVARDAEKPHCDLSRARGHCRRAGATLARSARALRRRGCALGPKAKPGERQARRRSNPVAQAQKRRRRRRRPSRAPRCRHARRRFSRGRDKGCLAGDQGLWQGAGACSPAQGRHATAGQPRSYATLRARGGRSTNTPASGRAGAPLCAPAGRCSTNTPASGRAGAPRAKHGATRGAKLLCQSARAPIVP